MSEVKGRPLTPRHLTPPEEQTPVWDDLSGTQPGGVRTDAVKDYPYSDVPPGEYRTEGGREITAALNELRIPGLGRFTMAVRTKAGLDEDVIKTPGLTTVEADERKDGWTGDFGFMRNVGGGLIAVVVDPVSEAGEEASRSASECVNQVCEVVREQKELGSAIYHANSALVQFHNQMVNSSTKGYFTIGLLAIDRNYMTQLTVGDAGFLYFMGDGFYPRDIDMLKLGTRRRDGRFAPNVVGYRGHIERMRRFDYRGRVRDRFGGGRFLFCTDILQKVAGYKEWDSPGGKSEKLDRVLAADDPVRELVGIGKGLDDVIVVYGELEPKPGSQPGTSLQTPLAEQTINPW